MKRKLFLLLCALLGMLASVQAALTEGDYLIKNVETGQYLVGGFDWGTHAGTHAMPQWFTLSGSGTTFTLDSHQFNGENYHFLGSAASSNPYVDSGTTNWTIEEVSGSTGIYTLKCGKYLSSDGKDKQCKVVEAASNNSAKWQLISATDFATSLTSATFVAGVDATAYIKDPELKRNGNFTTWSGSKPWAITNFNGSGTPKQDNNKDACKQGSGNNDASCCEVYHSTGGFKISQTITGLKVGWYALTAQAFYRQDGSSEKKPYLFAQVNSGTVQMSTFPVKTGTENSMTEAYSSFLSRKYPVNTIPFYVTSESDIITIGYAGEDTEMWSIFGETQLTYYGSGSASNYDVTTSVITNPSFETGNTTGWTYKTSTDHGAKSTSNNTYKMTGSEGNYLFNIWEEGHTISQALSNLPAGVYKLTAVMGTDAGNTFYLKMGENTGFASSVEKGTGVETTVYAKLTNKGNITISADAGGSQWYKVDKFKLTYNPTLPDSWTTTITGTMNSTTESEQTAAIEAYNAASGQTADNLVAVQAAVYAALLSKQQYKKIATIKANYDAKAESLDAAGQAAYVTATTAAGGATTKYNDGTFETAAEAEEAYNANYVTAVKAQTTPNQDWTDAIVNPSFETGNINGWTSTGTVTPGTQSNSSFEKTGTYYCEAWQPNGTVILSQTIGNLPNGVYAITVKAKARELTDAYLFAGDGKHYMKIEDSANDYTAYAEVTDGSLTFGINTISTAGWIAFDNFRLTNNPTTMPTDEYIDSFVESGVMSTTAATAQSTAVATYKSEKTVANWNAAMDKIGEARASKRDYASLLSAITAATNHTAYSNLITEYTPVFSGSQEDLNGAIETAQGVYDTHEVTSCSAAITALNDAIHAAYQDDYAKFRDDYDFDYSSLLKSDMTQWRETNWAILSSDQHWNCKNPQDYYEQTKAEYGQNSWSHSGTETVTLPAGNYVMSLICRSSSGVTSSMSVKVGDAAALTTAFAKKGDTGLGVTKNGAGSYITTDSTYANNNAGRGWEYRFIPFTVAEESPVTITVSASTSTKNNWVSITSPLLKGDVDPVLVVKNQVSGLVNELESYENLISSETYSTFTTDIADAKAALLDPDAEYETVQAFVGTLEGYISTASNERTEALTALANAIAKIPTANIGTRAFQYIEQSPKTFATIKSEALAVYDNESSSYVAVTGQTESINDLTIAVNVPGESVGFYVIQASAGWTYEGKAMTYTNGRPAQENPKQGDGQGSYSDNLSSNKHNQQVYFNQIDNGNSFEYKMYFKYEGTTSEYFCQAKDVVSGGSANGVRFSTDASKAMTVVVSPSLTNEGDYTLKCKNVEFFGSQDAGIYLTSSHTNFNITDAAATMQVSGTAKMGTFCAPFNVAIPEGVTAYEASISSDKWVHLEEIGSGDIDAGTPVILSITADDTFSQTFYGVNTAEDPDDSGVLKGLYEAETKMSGENPYYIMQYSDSKTAFFRVPTGQSRNLGANRCYLQPESNLTPARIAIGGEDDDFTAIDELKAIEAEAKTMKDGKYLVKGRIVIVKNGKAFGANGQKLK